MPPPPRGMWFLNRWDVCAADPSCDYGSPSDRTIQCNFTTIGQSLTTSIATYIPTNGEKVFLCPSQNEIPTDQYRTANANANKPRWVGYQAFWRAGRWWYGSPRRVNDGPDFAVIGDFSVTAAAGSYPKSNHISTGLRASGANWAFLDGHAAWLTDRQLRCAVQGEIPMLGVPVPARFMDLAWYGAY